MAETVTVSGQTPIVDVQSTQTQRVLNNEVIAALPTGRTPMSLATLIPGAVGFLGAQDVGGTDSLGAINGQFSIHGGSNNDMRVMTEGFYTGGNRSGLQFGNNQPNVGSTEEVSIDVAGNTAERAEGGILINFVPKSGGNRYTGLLFVSGTGSGLSGSNLTQRVKDLGFQTDAKVKNTYDINPAFGGPIKQDKLWFFTSARFFGYENYTGMLGNKNAGIANVWTYEPDEGNRLFNKAYSRDANLRLTYQINPKNKLSVFWDSQYKCECQQTGNSSFWSKLSGLIVSQEAAPAFYIYPTDTGIVTWSSPLTNRLLLEAGAAYRREDYHVPVRYWRAGDPLLDQINVLDVGTNLVYHGITGGGGPTAAGAFTDSISWTPQFRAALSYVAGAHSLKVGFNDTYLKAHDSNLINTTGTAYIFFSGTPIQVAEKTAYNVAGSVPWDLGIYAQERWTHKRLTLDLGLRYSYFENYSPDQLIGSTLHLPNRNFVLPAATFFSMKDLTPRLGAAYDLFGNGKTALKVGANKYLAAPPPLAGNPATTLISSANRSWNDRTLNAATGVTGNFNFVPDCDLTNVAANGECGPLPSSFGQAGSATTFDPATYQGWGVRQYNWEFSGSVQHELVPRVSVDVGYFRRIYGNLQVQYNRALPASAYDVYTVTAPTDPRLAGNSGQVVGPLYDIKPEVACRRDSHGQLFDHGGQSRQDVHTLERGGRQRHVTPAAAVRIRRPEHRPDLDRQLRHRRTGHQGGGSYRHNDQRRPGTFRNQPPVLQPANRVPDASERIRRVYVAVGGADRCDVPEHPRPDARGERQLHVAAGGPVARPAAVRRSADRHGERHPAGHDVWGSAQPARSAAGEGLQSAAVQDQRLGRPVQRAQQRCGVEREQRLRRVAQAAVSRQAVFREVRRADQLLS